MNILLKTTVRLFLIAFFSYSFPSLATLEQSNKYVAWSSYSNLTRSQYLKKLDEHKAKNHRPIDVEILSGTKPTYSVIFQKNSDSRKWAVHTQLDNKGFSKKWNYYKNKNYRLTDLASYKKGSSRYYSGIWIKNTEKLKWASYRNLSSKAFAKKFKSLSKKGYMPIDVNGYKNGSSIAYTTIWQKPKKKMKWILKRNISKNKFASYFKEFKKDGFRVYSFNSYEIKGKLNYAVIWIKDPKSTRWVFNRDMNQNEFNNKWNKYRDLGYRLSNLEVYKQKKKIRYAGLWLENSSRPSWQPKKSVSQKVSDYLLKDAAMGFSVGVAVDGKIRYLNNWGFTDSKNSIAANSRSVYRIASVSKAVTGVLAFALKDKKKLKLNRKTRKYEKRLPKRHRKHTVGDLLANRGKVRHYKDDDPATSSGTVKIFKTAYSASKLFTKDKLVSDDYLYSTHGYTLASAAMEAATKNSFCQLVQNYITKPNKLNSLACEITSNKIASRSKIYERNDKQGFTELKRLNLSWKYPGGGMESSSYDLLRFGVKLDQYKIISEKMVDEMTTRPDTKAWYAYGWDIGTSNGVSWYGKIGGQPGARTYIRIVPDKNIVVVLLANTSGDGGAIRDLGKEIANSLF